MHREIADHRVMQGGATGLSVDRNSEADAKATLADGASPFVHPGLLDLNLDFLLAHKVAPLRVSTDTLMLGMRDPGDSGAIAAVAFATGLAVDPVPISEPEWAVWRSQLASANDAATIVLRLGVRSVRATLFDQDELAFDFADHDGWAQVAARAGRKPGVSVIISAEATWEVAMRAVNVNKRELRRALAQRSPLRLEQAAWSSPVADGAGIRISLVRKAWLRQRLARIRTALSPATLTVTDEAGGIFDHAHDRKTAVRIAAAGAGCLVLVLGLMAIANQVYSPPASPGTRASGNVPVRVERRSPELAGPPVAVPAPPAAAADTQADAFELVGIAGRLPRDGVALIRPPWGKTVVLRVGDSLLGWRIASIAADRVVLAKGAMTRELVLKVLPPGQS